MASYKESKGFRCGVQRPSQVAYEFRYQVATNRFKARFPDLEVDEDPYVKLPSDVEVLAPVEVTFDNSLTSRPP